MLLLGIDVGTSSTKVLLCDDRGRTVATASRDYPLDAPHPGWSQQDPQAWWTAARDAVAQIVGETPSDQRASIAAIGLSGQMHGLVLLDQATLDARGARDGALAPAMLWNDQRTAAQCAEIERTLGGKRALVQRCGNAALPGFTLPKMLWQRAHQPAIWNAARAAIMPKDYVRFRLTGEIATDVGDGAGTLLLDLDRRAWSEASVHAFGIDPAILPRVAESCEVAGHVTRWAASQTGLPVGIPVVAGSGDNMAGALGAGVVTPGALLITLGTSGVAYAHTSAPRRDLDPTTPGRFHAMCAADGTEDAPGGFCVTGCSLSAAGCVRWLHDTMFKAEDYPSLIEGAGRAPPGSAGLLFLPQLTGERCPFPDPEARGAWVGLTIRHTREHLIRSVLEGVCLTMRQIVDLMSDAGVSCDRVLVGGGGARSPLWRQILADVLQIPVQLPDADEGPALGAALMAGVGARVWPSVSAACGQAISIAETRDPSADAHVYESVRRTFNRVYPALAPLFPDLGAIDRARAAGQSS